MEQPTFARQLRVCTHVGCTACEVKRSHTHFTGKKNVTKLEPPSAAFAQRESLLSPRGGKGFIPLQLDPEPTERLA